MVSHGLLGSHKSRLGGTIHKTTKLGYSGLLYKSILYEKQVIFVHLDIAV